MVCFLCLGWCCSFVMWCRGCSGCCVFCLSCDACRVRCCFIGRIFVSSCRCWVLVSSVHPVAIRSAVFCIICSLFVLVSDIMGAQIVLAYSSMGLVMAVYVLSIVSFVFPQCVDVSDLSMFIVFLALFVVFCMCLE